MCDGRLHQTIAMAEGWIEGEGERGRKGEGLYGREWDGGALCMLCVCSQPPRIFQPCHRWWTTCPAGVQVLRFNLQQTLIPLNHNDPCRKPSKMVECLECSLLAPLHSPPPLLLCSVNTCWCLLAVVVLSVSGRGEAGLFTFQPLRMVRSGRR